MSSEPVKPATPSNGPPADLGQEVERLREAVRRLEEARRVDTDASQGSRTGARRVPPHRLRHRARPLHRAGTDRIPDEKDCLPFEAFAAAMEEIVNGNGREQ